MTATGRIIRHVPAATWLRSYQRRWLPRDLLGGLVAGSVVIPQAMAYASVADLPAEVGLYTCMVPMLVYALVGGSRTLSISTTSTVALLTGSTLLAADVAASSGDPARDLATLTVLVGVILLVARLLRLGSLIEIISDATLTGIKIGVGLTVAAGQLPKLLGVEGNPSAGAFLPEVLGVIDDLDGLSWTTVAVSAATIAVLVGIATRAPRLPAPLIVVALGIAFVGICSIDEHGVALIAPIPSGLPRPVLPRLDGVGDLLGGALAIAVMCFLETAAVANAVRRRDEPAIDNNQELAANATACVFGGVFRSMPAAGGFSQTATNRGAGSRTQLSQVASALLAVACALFLGGVLSDLPEATLGCIVLVAVVGLIDVRELHRYRRVDQLSFWLATLTATAGLLFGLLAAVLLGVVVTLILVLHQLNNVGVTELQTVTARDDLDVAGPNTTAVPGLLILRVDGPLYAANVGNVCTAILDAVDAVQPTTVVIDASTASTLTVTVIDRFAALEEQLSDRATSLWLAALPPQARTTAERTAYWDRLVANGQIHLTTLAALHAYLAEHGSG